MVFFSKSKNFFFQKNNFIFILIFFIGNFLALIKPIKSDLLKPINLPNLKKKINNKKHKALIATINWVKVNSEESKEKIIHWDKLNYQEYKEFKKLIQESFKEESTPLISSLNRSIVIDELYIGPDIAWLVPPAFSWSQRYKFDSSIRGHNRRKANESFFGWNNGDAVGQFYYQPINNGKNSYGLNFGVRSVYAGTGASGGKSRIGEGLSLGFRHDRRISKTAGLSLGGEQILQFDGLSDTGRDFYITFSKGWWRNKKAGNFPLYVATGGVATGKMAEGNIKGLCSNLFGGSGTEVNNQRSLCWAPVFSLAKVYNHSFSNFFEYNSKFFLLGTSYVPFKNIPLRGTFAIQLSDHINNYKLNNLDNMKWVFRLSLGF